MLSSKFPDLQGEPITLIRRKLMRELSKLSMAVVLALMLAPSALAGITDTPPAPPPAPGITDTPPSTTASIALALLQTVLPII